MIISASRRCDIPNYQSDWFYEAIKSQELTFPQNLFLGKRIPLKKEDVDCIVFWTKNPEPMLYRLHELDGYHYYFQFTLTGYSRKIEPGVPDKIHMLEVFKNLSVMTSLEQVIWRYDPIFLSKEYDLDYHKKAFQKIAESLDGYTKRCVISFVDIYGHVKPGLEKLGIREPSWPEIQYLAEYLSETARKHGISVETCAERADLSAYGINKTHCIDAALIESLTGKKISPAKDPTQRPVCGCCKSIDIGNYKTCKNGCVYCYATKG